MIPQMTEAEFYERLGEVEIVEQVVSYVPTTLSPKPIPVRERTVTRHLRPEELDAIVAALSKPDIESQEPSSKTEGLGPRELTSPESAT